MVVGLVFQAKDSPPVRVQTGFGLDFGPAWSWPGASAPEMADPLELYTGTSSCPAPCPNTVRMSTCETAGKHNNRYHLPLIVWSRANGATSFLG